MRPGGAHSPQSYQGLGVHGPGASVPAASAQRRKQPRLRASMAATNACGRASSERSRTTVSKMAPASEARRRAAPVSTASASWDLRLAPLSAWSLSASQVRSVLHFPWSTQSSLRSTKAAGGPRRLVCITAGASGRGTARADWPRRPKPPPRSLPEPAPWPLPPESRPASTMQRTRRGAAAAARRVMSRRHRAQATSRVASASSRASTERP
mmetsp:Transcript_3552/g.10201  ORF Transcript_3552/g.10201 Transcript_3552/m.10201 type:complete len:211 (-) Transcript_3552:252-884(-)